MLECDWILKSLKISLIRQLYDCLYEQPKQVYRNRNYTDVCKKEEWESDHLLRTRVTFVHNENILNNGYGIF